MGMSLSLNKQDKIQFTAENYILICVCSKLLAATEEVAAAAAARRGGGGNFAIGKSCFTGRLHSWRTSHKLDTKFPF